MEEITNNCLIDHYFSYQHFKKYGNFTKTLKLK